MRLLAENNIDDAVIGGRLSEILCRPRDALAFFERGVRLSAGEGNFLDERRCLEGVCHVFDEQEASGDLPNGAASAQAHLNLLWNEIQRGSQFSAEKMLNTLRIRFQSGEDGHTNWAGVSYEATRTLARYRLVLDLRRGLARTFCSDFIEFLELSPEGGALTAGLTRLLLFCIQSCKPAHAVQVLRTIYGHGDPFEGQSPAALSSILSDVGHLFLVQSPETTERLWREGLAAASLALGDGGIESYRQWAHSHTNSLIVTTMLYPNEAKADQLELFMAHLKAKGITNPLIRLTNCYATLLLHRGEIQAAKDQFLAGLRLARSTSSDLFEWLFTHNLAILHLMDGDPHGATEYLARAIRSAAGPVSGIAMDVQFEQVMGRLRQKFPISNVDAKLPAPAAVLASLQVCGTHSRLARTYRTFKREVCGGGGPLPHCSYLEGWPEAQESSPLLQVIVGHTRLILSVE